MTARKPRIAFYAGSFNPFTVGHADIVERALSLFDAVVIGVGINIAKEGAAGRATAVAESISALYAAEPRVSVTAYTGLTCDAARAAGACALLRGARTCRDFESEQTLADVNRRLAPELQTVILPARPELACISSSMVRELAAAGAPTAQYIPTPVTESTSTHHPE